MKEVRGANIFLFIFISLTFINSFFIINNASATSTDDILQNQPEGTVSVNDLLHEPWGFFKLFSSSTPEEESQLDTILDRNSITEEELKEISHDDDALFADEAGNLYYVNTIPDELFEELGLEPEPLVKDDSEVKIPEELLKEIEEVQNGGEVEEGGFSTQSLFFHDQIQGGPEYNETQVLWISLDRTVVWNNYPYDFSLGSGYEYIPKFDLESIGLGGHEAEVIEHMVKFVKEDYAPYNVTVTTKRPKSQPYTAIYVGGTGGYVVGTIIGKATMDYMNSNLSNYGFVYPQRMGPFAIAADYDPKKFAQYLANVVSHEAGHTFGLGHYVGEDHLMHNYVSKTVDQCFCEEAEPVLEYNLGYKDNVADDFGSSLGEAKVIELDSNFTGILEKRSDKDYFSFTAEEGNPIIAEIKTLKFGNLDAVLKIYKSGQLIKSNDNYESSKDPLIEFSTISGEDYVIEVSSKSEDFSGSYNLIVNGSGNEYRHEFHLHSKPDSKKKIYLDFDGFNFSGTYFNEFFFNCEDAYFKPFGLYDDFLYPKDLDDNFTEEEFEIIRRVWEIVSEDFVMFDVDVTTEDPGIDALVKTNESDEEYGQRIVFSHDGFSDSSGRAKLGSFNSSYGDKCPTDNPTDVPAFVSSSPIMTSTLRDAKREGRSVESAKAEAIIRMANVASHEAGHTFDLHHNTPNAPNYLSLRMNPIPTSNSSIRWGNGEAKNYDADIIFIQDDLAQINKYLDYVNDDHIDIAESVSVAWGRRHLGLISGSDDSDFFGLPRPIGGRFNITARPLFNRSLDLEINLWKETNDGSSIVYSSNPVGTEANIRLAMPESYYYSVEVRGAESNATEEVQRSEYGSLGSYELLIDFPNDTQTLYLDFDGDLVYNNYPNDFDLGRDYVLIPEYNLSSLGFGGQEQESINQIVEFVKGDFAAYNINVTTVEPLDGEYTTVYVGGSSWYSDSIIGRSTLDVSNRKMSNYAFVFSENAGEYATASEGSLIKFSEYIANFISHQAGHTYGLRHLEGNDDGSLMTPLLDTSKLKNSFGRADNENSQGLLGSSLGYKKGVSDDFAGTIWDPEMINGTGDFIEGILEGRLDEDFFKFQLNEDVNFSIRLDSNPYGNLKGNLTLYNGMKRVLDTSKQQSPGVTTEINYENIGVNSYYIRVMGGDDISSGEYSFEILNESGEEERGTQVFYLNFEGGRVYNESGEFDLEAEYRDIPVFNLSGLGYGGREQESIEHMMKFIEEDYKVYDINFTTVKPAEGEYTTVYVGGADWRSNNYGRATVDIGNSDPENYGFVFPESFDKHIGHADDLLDMSRFIGSIIAHEAGHTLGLEHVDERQLIMYPYLHTTGPSSFGSDGIIDNHARLITNVGYKENLESDVGQTIGNSSSIDFGVTESLLDNRDDVDVFNYTANFSGDLDVRIVLSNYSNLNPVLRILDSEGDQIIIDDNYFDGKAPNLTVSVVDESIYFFEVSSGGYTSGSYNLSIEEIREESQNSLPSMALVFESKVNETGIVNLSVTLEDLDLDQMNITINDSRFEVTSFVVNSGETVNFVWETNYAESGNYTFNITLNDSKGVAFEIVELEVLNKERPTQVLFIEFDPVWVYNNYPKDFHLGRDRIYHPGFNLSELGYEGREEEAKEHILNFVREDYAAYNVYVTKDKPEGNNFTTIYVGGEKAYTVIEGQATYDIGNAYLRNYGFVWTGNMKSAAEFRNDSLLEFSEYIANTISHEAGHTFGLWHIEDSSAMMHENIPKEPTTIVFKQDELLAENLGYRNKVEDDYSDDLNSAEIIVYSSDVSGILESVEDVDVFNYTANFTGDLEVKILLSDYSNLNPALKVMNVEGQQIAVDQDYNDGKAPNLTVSVVNGEAYFFEVRSGGYTSGSYNLSLSRLIEDSGEKGHQIFYINFEGARVYEEPDEVELDAEYRDIPPFNLSSLGFGGREEVIKEHIMRFIEEDYATYNVTITDVQPTEGEYTTAYIGGKGWHGSTFGWGTIDLNNSDLENYAFVFPENFKSNLISPYTEEELSRSIGTTISHELGHNLGLTHNMAPSRQNLMRAGYVSTFPRSFGNLSHRFLVEYLGYRNGVSDDYGEEPTGGFSYEETFDEATRVNTGVVINASTNYPRDIDSFIFTAPKTGNITINVTTEIYSNLVNKQYHYGQVFVFDENENTIINDTETWVNYTNVTFEVIEGKDYHIWVNSLWTFGSYTLHIGEVIEEETEITQNSIPVVDSISLVSTDLFNRTNGSLAGSFTLMDSDGDLMTNETRWYKDSVEVAELRNLNKVSFTDVSKGENWTFSVRAYDGENHSLWKNVSILILNAVVEMSLSYNETVNETDIVNITVSVKDVDAESLEVTINDSRFEVSSFDVDSEENISFIWRTDLSDSGVYSFKIKVNDSEETVFETVEVEVLNKVEVPQNGVPEIVSINLLSTDNLNRTQGSLIGNFLSFDFDNDPLTNETRWYKDSVEVVRLRNVSMVLSSNTSKGENWTFSVRSHDGSDYSVWKNLSIMIRNNLPIVDVTYEDEVNVSDTFYLKVKVVDLDGDSLNVSINDSRFNKMGQVISSGEQVIFNWTPEESDEGTHSFKINISDFEEFVEAVIFVGVEEVIIIEEPEEDNTVPVIKDMELSSTDNLNRTNSTLSVSFSTIDADGDDLKNEIKWFKNGVEVEELWNISVVESEKTSKREWWEVKARVFDGKNYSEWLNDSIFIRNTRPEVVVEFDEVVLEGDYLTVNVTVMDLDEEEVIVLINGSKFRSNDNIVQGNGIAKFNWKTKPGDKGDYVFKVSANDSSIKVMGDIVVQILEGINGGGGGGGSSGKLIKGNLTSLNTSLENVSIIIDGEKNLSKITEGKREVEIVERPSSGGSGGGGSEKKRVIFNWTFNQSKSLDLEEAKIFRQNRSFKYGWMIIKGINLTGETKSVYVDRILNLSHICLKDMEMENLSEVTPGCKGENEFFIECNSSIQFGYNCTISQDNLTYIISGLKHSGIVEMCSDSDGDGYGVGCVLGPDCDDLNSARNIDCSVVEESDPPAGGGGGGGGGSGPAPKDDNTENNESKEVSNTESGKGISAEEEDSKKDVAKTPEEIIEEARKSSGKNKLIGIFSLFLVVSGLALFSFYLLRKIKREGSRAKMIQRNIDLMQRQVKKKDFVTHK